MKHVLSIVAVSVFLKCITNAQADPAMQTQEREKPCACGCKVAALETIIT